MSTYPDGCTEDHIAELYAYEDTRVNIDIDTDMEAVIDHINEIIEAVYVVSDIEKLEDNLDGLASEFGISLSSMDLGKILLQKRVNNMENKNNRLIPLSKWGEYHPWPPLGGLRHLVFNAKTNGFDTVVKKVGGRTLIDEKAFFAWVDSEDKKNKDD